MTVGVQGWLAGFPSTWKLLPAKAVFQERREPNRPDDVHLTPSQTHGVLPQAEYVARTGNAVVQNIQGQNSMKHVDPDDFIIHLRSFQGGIERSTYEGKVSTAYTVLEPHGVVEADYFRWLLKSDGYIQELRTTTNQLRDGQSIKFRDFIKIPLPVPPLDDQRAIADYLDRETARIDTLIGEQQRLVEMLRERRQAVIDAAFSSLGGPSVQLRRYITFLTSGSRGWGDYYADDGERFLRISNLPRTNLTIRGDIQFVDLPENVTEGSRTMLHDGDLLFSITAYLGSVAVVERDWVGAHVSQHVALCRLDRDRVHPRFIGWFMLSTTGQDQLNEGAAGGTKVQLALDDIRGLRVPTVPMDEQRRMAAHLDQQAAKTDALIAEIERFIELARERRAALITAAVTGQIDLREVA